MVTQMTHISIDIERNHKPIRIDSCIFKTRLYVYMGSVL